MQWSQMSSVTIKKIHILLDTLLLISLDHRIIDSKSFPE